MSKNLLLFRSLLLSAIALGCWNANAAAQTDCWSEAEVSLTTDIWGSEVSWSLSLNEEIILTGSGYTNYSNYVQAFCMDSTNCYTLELFDSFGDGWNGAVISVNIPTLGLMFGDFTIDSGSYAAYSFGLSNDCVNPDPSGGTGGWNGGGSGGGILYGCTDPNAINFNPLATIEDGSCTYACEDGGEMSLLYLCTFSQGNNVALEIATDSGEVVFAGSDFSNFDIVYFDLCLSDGCYTATLSNTGGEAGWYNGYFYINMGWNQIVYATLPDDQSEWSFEFSIDGSCGDVFGCTDPDSPNYNPNATSDDGSCLPSCNCADDAYDPVCGYNWLTGFSQTFNNLCELECAGAYLLWDGDCSEQPIYGCTDPDALNYNASATQNSGCLYPLECDNNTIQIVVPSAAFSDSLFGADFNDYPVFSWNLIDGQTGLYWYDFVQYTDSVGTWISEGCIDDGCYNFSVYNSIFDISDAAIEVVVNDEVFFFAGDPFEWYTVYALGVNEEGCEVNWPGCTDPTAVNYDPNATEDNGSCVYPFTCEEGWVTGQLYVCTFSNGANVGLSIVDEEGNAIFDQQGFSNFQILYQDVCLNPESCYTVTMTNNSDGTGWYGGYFYLNAAGAQITYESLNDNLSAEYIQFALNGSCGDVYGCTDPNAFNFNNNATIDDGSCFYPIDCEGLTTVTAYVEGGLWLNEISWIITSVDGQVWFNGSGDMVYWDVPMEFCAPDGCYELILMDSFGDGWNGNILYLVIGDELFEFTVESGSLASYTFAINADCTDDPDPIVGCTDAGALNYNPSATADDGSCEFTLCPTNEVTFVTVSLENGTEMGWSLAGNATDNNAIGGMFFADNSTHQMTTCLANGCYEVSMWDLNGDGWNGGWLEVWMDGELMTTASMEDGAATSMELGINAACEESDGGGAPFEFPEPIGFAPYPNPTEENVNLNGNGFDQHLPISIDVRDITGRLVHRTSFVPNGDASLWIMPSSTWESGIYQVSGTQGNRSANTQIVVQ